MEFEEDDDQPTGAPEWMVTFADLMSLLLTFFVLLLSFSNMEVVKFRTMAGQVRNALGLKSEFDIMDVPTGDRLLPHPDPREGSGGEAPTPGETRAPTDEEMTEQLNAMLAEAGLAQEGMARVTKHGVVLQLEGDTVFESGSTDISPKAATMLEGLARYIAAVGKTVDVVGHTDNVPISTPAFPSNWELSAARAGQAVRRMVEVGVPPENLRAIGQAETVPLTDNSTPEGRAMNRRIEFVFTTREEAPAGGVEELGSGASETQNDE